MNLNSKIDTVESDVETLNNSQISYTDVNTVLTSQTWSKSASGVYYSGDISLSANPETVISLTIIGFSALRTTDILQPMISTDGKKIRFLSNTNAFISGDAAIKLRIGYIPA